MGTADSLLADVPPEDAMEGTSGETTGLAATAGRKLLKVWGSPLLNASSTTRAAA
jgi:hypothetical protein